MVYGIMRQRGTEFSGISISETKDVRILGKEVEAARKRKKEELRENSASNRRECGTRCHCMKFRVVSRMTLAAVPFNETLMS